MQKLSKLHRSFDSSFWRGLIAASFLSVALAFAIHPAQAHGWHHRYHHHHHRIAHHWHRIHARRFIPEYRYKRVSSFSSQPGLFDFLIHDAQTAPQAIRRTVERAGHGAVAGMVRAAAAAQGVPVRLAMAVARVEGMSCTKIGSVGERGPMQVRPQTAHGMGLHPHSCAQWVDAGVRYLKIAITMHGTGCGGATAYNMGTYTRNTFCTGYGRTVMALMSRGSRWEARGTPKHRMGNRRNRSFTWARLE